MREPIDTIEYRGCSIKIYTDDDPQDPRQDDNLGRMICFHGKYSLGDKTELKSSMFDGWQALRGYLIKEYEAKILLPLYLYDHSGITMRAGRSFGDIDPQGWDSGCVGFIYATRPDMVKEYGKLNKLIIVKAEKLLINEVKTYDDYLTGDVFGFVAEDKQGQGIHSCWGFFGDTKYMITEAQAAIDYHIKDIQAKNEARLKAFIKNKVGLEYRELVNV